MIRSKIVVKVNKLPSLSGALRREVGQSVQSVAEQCAEEVRNRAPVDEGKLKGSIDVVQESDLTQRVEIGQFYGRFQEYGTRKMRPHPFVTPAVETVRPVFDGEMKAVFGKIT